MGPTVSLPVVLFIYVGIIFAQSGLHRYQSNLNTRIQQSFHSFLSIRLLQAVANAKWSFLAARKKADITHLLTSELARVSAGTQIFLQMTATAVLSLIQVAIAFILSPGLTLAVLLGGIVFFFFMQGFVKEVKIMGADLSRQNRDLFFALAEHLDGIKEVKSCGMEAIHVRNFIGLRKAIENNFVCFNQIQSRTQMLYKAGAALFISLFFYGAVQFFHTKAQDLLLIVVIFARLWPRLSSFQGGLQNVVMMLPAFSSLVDFERSCRKEKDLYLEQGSFCPGELTKGIELKQVSFRYHPGSGVWAVYRLNLDIPAGKTIALVGVSGAGKSTVADLLTGMLTPQEGEIFIDGVPMSTLDHHLWRKSVGYVPQDAFLFHASLRENLLWAFPGASEDEIWEALKWGAVDEFVAGLPEGLDTVVGDRGICLSGGERQRIVLARALLRKPSVLILDEATSSLDMENEKRIHQAIENLHGKLTILIIAHRLSTIRNADRIIVLEKGVKVEEGTYEDLTGNQESRFYRINLM